MASKDVQPKEVVREDGLPPWVISANKGLSSRWLTYTAVVLFEFDGVHRLLDGRIVRGMINVVCGVALAVLRETRWSERRQERAAAADAAAGHPRRWGDDHPILLAMVLGGVWGGFMSLFFVGTREVPVAFAFAIGLGGGVLFFGPGTVLLSRRARRRAAEYRAAQTIDQ